MIRRGRNLPLAAWAAIGGVAIVVTMVLLVGAVLARGGLDHLEVLALGMGLLVGLVMVGVGVFWSQRVTAGLRELHADAVRRLRDPSLRVSTSAPQLVGAATEFAELARVLDALHLRVRVADEVAEQSRRTAEQTSAGVFELLSGLVAAEEATRGQLVGRAARHGRPVAGRGPLAAVRGGPGRIPTRAGSRRSATRSRRPRSRSGP